MTIEPPPPGQAAINDRIGRAFTPEAVMAAARTG
jgi:hypothetical protein